MLRRSISSTLAMPIAHAIARSRISGASALALLFRQLLGVVQSGDRSCRIEDDRCGIHRTAQRAAPGFVDAAAITSRCGCGRSRQDG
jgi:hypothetical protein